MLITMLSLQKCIHGSPGELPLYSINRMVFITEKDGVYLLRDPKWVFHKILRFVLQRVKTNFAQGCIFYVWLSVSFSP